jgi:hypothetical protein
MKYEPKNLFKWKFRGKTILFFRHANPDAILRAFWALCSTTHVIYIPRQFPNNYEISAKDYLFYDFIFVCTGEKTRPTMIPCFMLPNDLNVRRTEPIFAPSHLFFPIIYLFAQERLLGPYFINVDHFSPQQSLPSFTFHMIISILVNGICNDDHVFFIDY